MANSGVDIANLRGDAAAAAGSSAFGNNIITLGDTDATRINQQVDHINQANLEKNKAIYDKKVADKDNLLHLLLTKQMQLKEMLPEDRNTVRSKYFAPMERFMLEDPDSFDKPDRYIQLQQKISDFDEAQSYAATRKKVIGDMDLDISKELDPDIRAAKISHRDQMQKQGLFQNLTPYQQQLDFSSDSLIAPPAIKLGTDQDLIGDKLVTVDKTRTPVADFIKGAIYNYTQNPKKTLHAQYDLYKRTFDGLPDDQKMEMINQWNQAAQTANANEGLKEGDLYYVKPYIPVKIRGADGQDHIALNETPDRLIVGQSLSKNYKSSSVPVEKVTDMGVTMADKKANTAQTLYENKYKLPAEVAKIYADIAKTRNENQKTLEETFKLRSENKQLNAAGTYNIAQTLHMLDPTVYAGAPRAETDVNFQSGISKFMSEKVLAAPADSQPLEQWTRSTKLTPQVREVLRNTYQNDQQVTKQQVLDAIASTNPVKGIILATDKAVKQKDGTTAPRVTSAFSSDELDEMGYLDKGKILKPKRVVLNADDPKNPVLIGYYYPEKKNAAGVMEEEKEPIIHRIEAQDVIQGVIKRNDSKDFEKTMQQLRTIGGSNDINTALGNLIQNGYLQKQLTGQDAKTVPTQTNISVQGKRRIVNAFKD